MVKEAAIFITKNDRVLLRNLIEVARGRDNGTDCEYKIGTRAPAHK